LHAKDSFYDAPEPATRTHAGSVCVRSAAVASILLAHTEAAIQAQGEAKLLHSSIGASTSPVCQQCNSSYHLLRAAASFKNSPAATQ
jgi:hypothetical protein